MAISTIFVRSTASEVPSKFSIFYECLKESAHDFVAGTIDFFTTRRAGESSLIAEGIDRKFGVENQIAKSAVALFANATYFIATPFHDAGTAIGEGLAAAIVAKSNIQRWEGIGTVALGVIAGANLAIGGAVAARVPIPMIKLPTSSIGSGGTMALASVGVAARGAQGVLVTSVVAAAGMPGSGVYTSQMSAAGDGAAGEPKKPASLGDILNDGFDHWVKEVREKGLWVGDDLLQEIIDNKAKIVREATNRYRDSSSRTRGRMLKPRTAIWEAIINFGRRDYSKYAGFMKGLGKKPLPIERFDLTMWRRYRAIMSKGIRPGVAVEYGHPSNPAMSRRSTVKGFTTDGNVYLQDSGGAVTPHLLTVIE